MRKLDFKGYLKQYIAGVSGQKTLNIHKLAVYSKTNYRLFDSLVLYCVFNAKKDILFKYIDNKEKQSLLDLSISNFLDDQYHNYDFQKIWESYLNKSNVTAFDNDTKNKIRRNIVNIAKEKRISNYRIYKDLNLNPGNVNDFLTNGNVNKVSLELVKKIYSYVNNY